MCTSVSMKILKSFYIVFILKINYNEVDLQNLEGGTLEDDGTGSGNTAGGTQAVGGLGVFFF